MKQVKIYYSDRDKLYADREAYTLKENGIEVEEINSATLSQKIITPLFVVYKHNTVLQKLAGKHSPGVVLSWVKKLLKETK